MYTYIGADIPGISETVIQSAFEALKHTDIDMVIGKAEDGGYYLIGFSSQAQRYIGMEIKVFAFFVTTLCSKIKTIALYKYGCN